SNHVPQIRNPGGKERTGVSKLTNQKLLITNYVKTNLAINGFISNCVPKVQFLNLELLKLNVKSVRTPSGFGTLKGLIYSSIISLSKKEPYRTQDFLLLLRECRRR